MENFKDCADSDTNTDVSVYQGEVQQKSCGTLQLTNGPEQSDQIYTLLCNAEGDTVKFSKSHGQISVYEVAIIRSTCKIFSVLLSALKMKCFLAHFLSLLFFLLT